MRYARGASAEGQCQRCGLFFKLNELVEDGYKKNLRVCRECFDPRPPQERYISMEDPQALYRPALENAPDGEGWPADDFEDEGCPVMGSYNIVELAVAECMIVRD